MLNFQMFFLFAPLTYTCLSTPLEKRAFSSLWKAIPSNFADFADPGFITVGDTSYAFSTANGDKNIPIANSADFKAWTLMDQDALPDIPAWSTGGTWAPDPVQLADGSFVLYFAAASKDDSSKHCVSAATSPTVTGPYKPLNTPLACHLSDGGAIDPAGFFDTDGTLYLVYKVDGNSLGGAGPCGNWAGIHSTPIKLQKMNPDGVTLTGDATTILDRGFHDGPLVEAPSLLVHDGLYVLFFSSSCYNTTLYDVSYATATSVAGPYTKASVTLLGGGEQDGLNSPGGADASFAGDKIVFHADRDPGDPSIREMWTAAINIDVDKKVVSVP